MRNKVEIKKNGAFSKKGLNPNEVDSLEGTRKELTGSYTDDTRDKDYIIAYYDKDEDEVFFATESFMTNCDKALLA